MLSSTRTAITAILSADPTIEAGKVPAAISAAEDSITGRKIVDVQAPMRRRAIAQKLGITPQRVDQYGKAGVLDRVIPKGSKRAIGYTRSSVDALMGGTK